MHSRWPSMLPGTPSCLALLRVVTDTRTGSQEQPRPRSLRHLGLWATHRGSHVAGEATDMAARHAHAQGAALCSPLLPPPPPLRPPPPLPADTHLRARLPQVYNLEPPTQGKVRPVQACQAIGLNHAANKCPATAPCLPASPTPPPSSGPLKFC